MFKTRESSQSEYEFVSTDELVNDDHFLRLIEGYTAIMSFCEQG